MPRPSLSTASFSTLANLRWPQGWSKRKAMTLAGSLFFAASNSAELARHAVASWFTGLAGPADRFAVGQADTATGLESEAKVPFGPVNSAAGCSAAITTVNPGHGLAQV